MIALDNFGSTPDPLNRFLACCVSVDLEVDPRTARIFALAAVRADGAPPILSRKGDLATALDRLEAALEGADHLIGHNILQHDLPHLAAARPRLHRLAAAPIDTLWLNPLAFPRNPYHHLVKHYQDGRLQAGHVNDPELDARLRSCAGACLTTRRNIAPISAGRSGKRSCLSWCSIEPGSVLRAGRRQRSSTAVSRRHACKHEQLQPCVRPSADDTIGEEVTSGCCSADLFLLPAASLLG